MIDEGTDGLSRLTRSSIMESSLALGGVRFSPALGRWALETVGLSMGTSFRLQDTLSTWNHKEIANQVSMWIPVPEVARQALVRFLDIWVEGPTTTSGIFLVPRIMQKDWGYICKHVVVLGEYYPWTLPADCAYDSHIPFVLLYIPQHVRTLPVPRLDISPPPPFHSKWHTAQVDYLRGL